MKSKEILEKLDLIDNYIRDNINENKKIQNPNDFFARNNCGVLQQIKKELEDKGAGKTLIDRVKKTENALLFTMDRAELEPHNNYFEWQNCTMKNTYYSKPDVDDIYNCITTGHLPNIFADYAEQYISLDTVGRELIIENFRNIEKEYNDFLEKDNKETSLVIRKRNPLQKLFDKIFNREKKVKNVNDKKDKYKNTNTNEHRKYCETLRNMDNYTGFQENHTIEKNAEKQQEIIVISDLHGNMEKWNNVKDYLSKNTNTKILILGDATDRGEHGIEILMQIKEMCDNGQAEYLPGNHDTFLYNYVKTEDILSKLTDEQKWQSQNIVAIAGRELAHLTRNGGEVTLENISDFDNIVNNEMKKGTIKNRVSKQELIEWLGKQPVQKRINVDNTEFALAHAWFDEELYMYDQNFNMEKALQLEMQGEKDNTILNKYKNVMWYRAEDDRTHYAEANFAQNYTMVVGHTPQVEGINVKNYSNNPRTQVIYIDTGKQTGILNLSNIGKSTTYSRK